MKKPLINFLVMASLLNSFAEVHAHKRIPLHGTFSAASGGHWQGQVLVPGTEYEITNSTTNTLTVMVLDANFPLMHDMYFPVMAGASQRFVAAGPVLDLYVGLVGGDVKGVLLREF